MLAWLFIAAQQIHLSCEARHCSAIISNESGANSTIGASYGGPVREKESCEDLMEKCWRQRSCSFYIPVDQGFPYFFFFSAQPWGEKLCVFGPETMGNSHRCMSTDCLQLFQWWGAMVLIMAVAIWSGRRPCVNAQISSVKLQTMPNQGTCEGR